MRTHQLLAVSLWCVGLAVAACSAGRTPANSSTNLRLDDLTPRERRDWGMLTRDMAAPCTDTPMSVDQCEKMKSGCAGCAAAARFLLKGVRDGRSRAQIEAAYRVRFAAVDPKPIDVSDAPMLGDPAAPVTVVEFADFQCPFCSTTVRVLDGLVRDFGSNVRVVFKHYPLATHSNADLAARASVAAQNQGRFWEMHHKLFENQRALSQPDLELYARDVGLDLVRFRADLASPEVAARVKRNISEGNRIGVNGTPTIFVNGRPFNLKLFDMSSDLTDWVQAEIEIKTGRTVEPAGSLGVPPVSSTAPLQLTPVPPPASIAIPPATLAASSSPPAPPTVAPPSSGPAVITTQPEPKGPAPAGSSPLRSKGK